MYSFQFLLVKEEEICHLVWECSSLRHLIGSALTLRLSSSTDLKPSSMSLWAGFGVDKARKVFLSGGRAGNQVRITILRLSEGRTSSCDLKDKARSSLQASSGREA